jgi:hypothetical protein
MANYGRNFSGPRGWFDRWFGGGGGGGYDRGYRRPGGYDRPSGRGYDRADYRSTPPWRQGGGDPGYGSPRGGGYFNPGYMVDEAWGGAFARGDAQYQGRRLYGDDYRTGRPGYGGGYDRPYRGGDAGWRRPFGRGYDRGR